jgi:hypothetical protein
MEQESGFNPEKELESIKKDFSRIYQPLIDLKSIKIKDPDRDERLKKLLNRLPSGDDLKKPYEETIQRLTIFVKKTETLNKESFSRSKNDYLQSLNTKGIQHRSVDANLLRVDNLEIELKPDTAQIRILYNRAVVLPWKTIRSADDIDQYMAGAQNKLKQAKINEKDLPKLIKNAYDRLKNKKEQEKKMDAYRVPLKPMHKAVITELFLQQINSKNVLNTKIEIDFPEWAFLYNLDLYRSMQNAIPAEYQLVFETGGMTETEKEGIILNGLTANSDFKKFCYLKGRTTN